MLQRDEFVIRLLTKKSYRNHKVKMLIVILAVVFTTVFAYYVYSIQFSSRGLPPGPFMWPFGLGVLPSALIRRPVFNISKLRPWEYFDLCSIYTDWNYRGYKIPKGTFIISNHFSVHMSKQYWGDPEVFRPERFINAKGDFVHDKRVVHFGYGKRICIGITLVNSIVPCFFASLLQKFNFSVVPGTKPPSTEPEIGVSLSPSEFSVLVEKR
ncbi:Methyl farnesoate epoxidase [Orchesella cincta]|uniref:Methyl farnesoate epoxidase n=1 Tax=Orchesella cincta TaxID=48709 RepID=A0A1D2MBV7_ORCCI|nr:Methyl farnesoate epoxidase [Orchesella cincta]